MNQHTEAHKSRTAQPKPPATITPDHAAAKWFADTQIAFVHSHIANLARCYLEAAEKAWRYDQLNK